MNKYSGFTLIEMLIVMGIIIILMAAGIAGGRFAIQRANRIQKNSAVDNIHQALMGYYSDKRSYPTSATGLSPADLLENDDYLKPYIDAGQFDGGADGSFYYFVDGIGQSFVVCVSYGGNADEMQQGIYCKGNGIDSGDINPPFDGSDNNVVPGGVYEHDDTSTVYDYIQGLAAGSDTGRSDWNGDDRTWD